MAASRGVAWKIERADIISIRRNIDRLVPIYRYYVAILGQTFRQESGKVDDYSEISMCFTIASTLRYIDTLRLAGHL